MYNKNNIKPSPSGISIIKVLHYLIAKIPKIPLEKSKGIILLIKNQDFTKSRHSPPTHRPDTRQQTVLLQSQIVGFQSRYRNTLQIGKV